MTNRTKVISIGLTCAMVVLSVFLIRNIEFEKPRVRPSKIPPTAVWGGGPDGGDWIDCRAVGATSGNVFYCEVYEDRQGEIVYKGLFRLGGRPATEDSVRALLGLYFGDKITLLDGRALIAVVPLDSASYDEMLSRKFEDYGRK